MTNMNNQDYEQKKREYWEEFKRENLEGEVQWQLVSGYDVFCAAFDRAYDLGKEKEPISQEEIEKAAQERADSILYDYRMEDMLRDDLRVDMINLFKDAIDFALGKHENDADTVIKGWVARDEDGSMTLFYGSDKPSKKDNDDYWSAVFGNTLEYLPQEMFPDVKWEDVEPTKIELIIKRKKK